MDTAFLSQLIGARHELLLELCQLARRQSALIDEADMSGFLNLLPVKQRVLNELLRVDRQLDPYRAQDPDRRPWRTVEDRAVCREAARQSVLLLAEIAQVERACEAELATRRDRTSAMFQRIHGPSRATQAYGALAELPGAQFDVSCET